MRRLYSNRSASAFLRCLAWRRQSVCVVVCLLVHQGQQRSRRVSPGASAHVPRACVPSACLSLFCRVSSSCVLRAPSPHTHVPVVRTSSARRETTVGSLTVVSSVKFGLRRRPLVVNPPSRHGPAVVTAGLAAWLVLRCGRTIAARHGPVRNARAPRGTGAAHARVAAAGGAGRAAAVAVSAAPAQDPLAVDVLWRERLRRR